MLRNSEATLGLSLVTPLQAVDASLSFAAVFPGRFLNDSMWGCVWLRIITFLTAKSGSLWLRGLRLRCSPDSVAWLKVVFTPVFPKGGAGAAPWIL
ncbi:MAG: hypothetical protein R3B07_23085 [Polyangiaceae bacterium]